MENTDHFLLIHFFPNYERGYADMVQFIQLYW